MACPQRFGWVGWVYTSYRVSNGSVPTLNVYDQPIKLLEDEESREYLGIMGSKDSSTRRADNSRERATINTVCLHTHVTTTDHNQPSAFSPPRRKKGSTCIRKAHMTAMSPVETCTLSLASRTLTISMTLASTAKQQDKGEAAATWATRAWSFRLPRLATHRQHAHPSHTQGQRIGRCHIVLFKTAGSY